MAEAAGAKALAASGLAPSSIDLVIVATCSPEVPLPNVAATVAYRLGIGAPGAYDLNAACAGFCYALGTASDAVVAGSARNVLVIGAEKMTSWIDWPDRSTCIIFADGAGPPLSGRPDGEPSGIGPVVWGSAGDLAERIAITGRTGVCGKTGRPCSGGRRRAAPGGARGVRAGGVTPADLSAFIPHQATCASSKPSPAARHTAQQVADDIVHAGNTSRRRRSARAGPDG
jgi:3-oxoacyl-[acyl-carrier-protein] synthase-3